MVSRISVGCLTFCQNRMGRAGSSRTRSSTADRQARLTARIKLPWKLFSFDAFGLGEYLLFGGKIRHSIASRIIEDRSLLEILPDGPVIVSRIHANVEVLRDTSLSVRVISAVTISTNDGGKKVNLKTPVEIPIPSYIGPWPLF